MRRATKLIAVLLTVLFISCDDVFEDDISDRTVDTIYPNEGVTIIGNVINFQWEPIDGADDYRLQIIQDDDSNRIVLDSLITRSGFTYDLEDGQYKWRIRGENFAYQTAYSFSISFSVEVSNDLETQSVILKSPVDGFYANNKSLAYTWNALTAADTYSFELQKNSSGLETILELDDISDFKYTPDETLYDEDAEYIWRVKAVNEISESNYSERSIFLDTQNPNQPTLESPDADGVTSNSEVTFSWANGTDTGAIKSSINSIVEISSDENFNAIINTSPEIDQASYEYTFSGTGDFFWHVKALDAAGNESEYSEIRKITVN